MTGLVRGWQAAGTSGIGHVCQTYARLSLLPGHFEKPYFGPLYEPQMGHSPREAKAYAKCRMGSPRREAQTSLTAPCAVFDSLRLKLEGVWCRSARFPQPGIARLSRVCAWGTPLSGPRRHSLRRSRRRAIILTECSITDRGAVIGPGGLEAARPALGHRPLWS